MQISLMLLKTLKKSLGPMLFHCRYQLVLKSAFKGVVDLITDAKPLFGMSKTMGMTFEEIPKFQKILLKLWKKWREKLLEAVAEYDDTLMEKFSKIQTLSLPMRKWQLLFVRL